MAERSAPPKGHRQAVSTVRVVNNVLTMNTGGKLSVCLFVGT
jgi:hypothetical protein